MKSVLSHIQIQTFSKLAFCLFKPSFLNLVDCQEFEYQLKSKSQFKSSQIAYPITSFTSKIGKDVFVKQDNPGIQF